jgi:dUTPase
MSNTNLKFYVQPGARAPKKAERSAGWDLYSKTEHDPMVIFPGESLGIGLGVHWAIETDDGYGREFTLKEKSGLSNIGLRVSGGVVDEPYRGEIKVLFNNTSPCAIYLVADAEGSEEFEKYKATLWNNYAEAAQVPHENLVWQGRTLLEAVVIGGEPSYYLMRASIVSTAKAICQGIVRVIDMTEAEIVNSLEDLGTTNRGDGGFGSTGH